MAFSSGKAAGYANLTKLTRMLVLRVNDWQQAYAAPGEWLAEENNSAFIK